MYHKAATRLTEPFSINFSFFLPRFHNRNPSGYLVSIKRFKLFKT